MAAKAAPVKNTAEQNAKLRKQKRAELDQKESLKKEIVHRETEHAVARADKNRSRSGKRPGTAGSSNALKDMQDAAKSVAHEEKKETPNVSRVKVSAQAKDTAS